MTTPAYSYSVVPSYEDKPLTVPVFGLLARAKASFIDGLILGVISFVLSLVIIFATDMPPGLMQGGTPTMEALLNWQTNLTVASNWMSIALYSIYYIGFWAAFGATPGKMMLGQKIVDSNGYPIGFGRAFVRYLGYMVGGAFFSLGHAMLAFDRQKRAFHDHLAGTRVVPADMPIPDDDTPLDFAAEGSSMGEMLLVLAMYVVTCGLLALFFGSLVYLWPEIMAEMGY